MGLNPLRIRAATGALALLTVSACARDRYMGINLRPGGALAEMQALARAARASDKHAQFRLGERYEHGEGIRRSADRAVELYMMASADSGGPIQMYVPRVGNAPARIERIERPFTPRLPEARTRLADFIRDTSRDSKRAASSDDCKNSAIGPECKTVAKQRPGSEAMPEGRVASIATRQVIAATPRMVFEAAIELLVSTRLLTVEAVSQIAVAQQRRTGAPLLTSFAFDQDAPCNSEDFLQAEDGLSPDQLRMVCRDGWLRRITLLRNDAVGLERSDSGEILPEPAMSEVLMSERQVINLAARLQLTLVDVTNSESFRDANAGHMQADIRGIALIPGRYVSSTIRTFSSGVHRLRR